MSKCKVGLKSLKRIGSIISSSDEGRTLNEKSNRKWNEICWIIGNWGDFSFDLFR